MPRKSTRDRDAHQSGDVKRAFELGYLAAGMRLRKEIPKEWRENVLGVISGELVDREEFAQQAQVDRSFSTHVGGVRLIVLRCEAAATMLSWRKNLPEKSADGLRDAIRKLLEEARRLGVAA
jgi:hypothetical protein